MSRKTLYFESYCGYIAYAITESGKLIEFNFEKRGGRSIVGSIYKGKVSKVLPGMCAAFVDCGLERNCYLSGEDAFPDGYDANGRVAPRLNHLKEGDEILVQVVKAPVDKKGARVSAHPRLVGKALIYMPDLPIVGVSRKITDAELRSNLIYTAGRIKEQNEGLILRTAAPYASRSALKTEYLYLKNIYDSIRARFTSAAVGDTLYIEADLPVRVLRDTLTSNIESIIVGNRELGKTVSDMIDLLPTEYRKRVVIHETGKDMMTEYGVAEQILASVSPRVELSNGAYLVIEKTEALTVIDVNTGKFTGDDSLEQTVYYTNVLAAREIARQVRLRDIGGIIVVDFIDMLCEPHRKAVTEELERALKDDKAKCAVAPMSKFGLVEFTRKRTGTGYVSHLARQCPECNGKGVTLTAEYVIFGIRAGLLNLIADGATRIRVDLSVEVYNCLANWNDMLDDIRANCKNAQIYAVQRKSYRYEQYKLDAAPAEIPEKALPLN